MVNPPLRSGITDRVQGITLVVGGVVVSNEQKFLLIRYSQTDFDEIS